MASARERRPGVWEMRQSLGRDPVTGKDRYASRTVHTMSDRVLRRALVAFEAEVGARGRVAVPKEAATVAQLVERWMEHICDGLTLEELAADPAAGPMSPKTVDTYMRLIRMHIVPTAGHIRLAKLTTYDIDLLCQGIVRRGHRRTAQQVHSLLRSALQQAVLWGWIGSNPADRAKKPSSPKPDVGHATPEAVRTLIDELERTDPALATFVFLAADAGARRGELCGLHWSDVDWQLSRVTIRCAVGAVPGRPPYEKSTKTHSVRSVHINAGTMEVLRRHRRAMDERAAAALVQLVPTAYVFSSAPDGARPWNPSTVSTSFARACRRAGVEGVRLHDLRHFVGTRLEAGGVPLSVIAGRLGHSKISTTSDMYVHHAGLDGDRAAADIMGALLAGPPPEPDRRERDNYD
jgi:integrase